MNDGLIRELEGLNREEEWWVSKKPVDSLA
jgi:hypothetical protein